MFRLLLIFLIVSSLTSCNKKGCTDPEAINYKQKARKDDGGCYYPTPYVLDIPPVMAQYLPEPYISPDNPLTEEGVALGRMLYYDKIIDKHQELSCSSCHDQDKAFSSGGSTLPHMNLAWNDAFLWNGRIQGTFEDIMLFEVEVFFETDVTYLNEHDNYPELFEKAFGVEEITTLEVAYALGQFMRTQISGNSKFDRYLLGEEALTPSEQSGYDIYMDEQGGDCFHCHGDANNPLWTDNDFHNNGLDATLTDLGLGAVTGNPSDNGKFKTPSLRNLSYTAPYMHDGRFATLDDVIAHYSVGVQASSPNIDPLMQHSHNGGAQLTPQEMTDLKAFLLTLNDDDFITDPDLQAP